MPITHTTPLGTLTLAATENGLSYCAFDDGPRAVEITPGRSGDVADPVAARGWLELARRELDAYFAGELRGFSVPVDLRAIPEAERRVLHLLGHVGYGRTTTYGAVALTAGLGPRGARSVGGAMARNPVLVVVACHRVLGASGSLTGYAGGLHRKQALLDLEGRDIAGTQLTLAG